MDNVVKWPNIMHERVKAGWFSDRDEVWFGKYSHPTLNKRGPA